MPSYHNARMDNVDLFVRPLGWRCCLKIYPYSQGDRVRFRIGVKDKTKPNPLGRIAIYEDILLPEGSQKEKFPLLTDPSAQMFAGKSPPYLDIMGSIMSVAGRGRYTINHPRSKEAIEIITFDAKRDATMFMWLTPAIVALIGTIVSVVLWVFVKN